MLTDIIDSAVIEKFRKKPARKTRFIPCQVEVVSILKDSFMVVQRYSLGKSGSWTGCYVEDQDLPVEKAEARAENYARKCKLDGYFVKGIKIKL